MFCFCNFHSRGKRERNGRNGYCRTKHTEPLKQEITTGGRFNCNKKETKKARKRDRKSIRCEHMHELLGLGGITVINFKKGTKKGPKKGPKKLTLLNRGPGPQMRNEMLPAYLS